MPASRERSKPGSKLAEMRLDRDLSQVELSKRADVTLRTLIRLEHLPNQRRLSELGYSRLGTAVARAGGAAAFCRQHGLPEPTGWSGSRSRPTRR